MHSQFVGPTSSSLGFGAIADAERIAADIDPSWSRSGYALTPLELAAAQSSADARRRAAAASRRRREVPKPWSPKGAWRGVAPSASVEAQTDAPDVTAQSDVKLTALLKELDEPLVRGPRPASSAPPWTSPPPHSEESDATITSALRRAAVLRTVSRVDRLAVAEDLALEDADTADPPSVFETPEPSPAAAGLWLDVPSSLPTAPTSRRPSLPKTPNVEAVFEAKASARSSVVTKQRRDADAVTRSSVIDELERLVTPALTPAVTPQSQPLVPLRANSSAASLDSPSFPVASRRASVSAVVKLPTPAFDAGTQTTNPRFDAFESDGRGHWASDDEKSTPRGTHHRQPSRRTSDDDSSPKATTWAPPPTSALVARQEAAIQPEGSVPATWNIPTDDDDDDDDASLRDFLFQPATHRLDPPQHDSPLPVSPAAAKPTPAADIAPILGRIQDMRRQLMERQQRSQSMSTMQTQVETHVSAAPRIVPVAPHVAAMQASRLERGAIESGQPAADVALHARNFFALRDQFFQNRDVYRTKRASAVAQVTFSDAYPPPRDVS